MEVVANSVMQEIQEAAKLLPWLRRKHRLLLLWDCQANTDCGWVVVGEGWRGEELAAARHTSPGSTYSYRRFQLRDYALEEAGEVGGVNEASQLLGERGDQKECEMARLRGTGDGMDIEELESVRVVKEEVARLKVVIRELSKQLVIETGDMRKELEGKQVGVDKGLEELNDVKQMLTEKQVEFEEGNKEKNEIWQELVITQKELEGGERARKALRGKLSRSQMELDQARSEKDMMLKRMAVSEDVGKNCYIKQLEFDLEEANQMKEDLGRCWEEEKLKRDQDCETVDELGLKLETVHSKLETVIKQDLKRESKAIQILEGKVASFEQLLKDKNEELNSNEKEIYNMKILVKQLKDIVNDTQELCGNKEVHITNLEKQMENEIFKSETMAEELKEKENKMRKLCEEKEVELIDLETRIAGMKETSCGLKIKLETYKFKAEKADRRFEKNLNYINTLSQEILLLKDVMSDEEQKAAEDIDNLRITTREEQNKKESFIKLLLMSREEIKEAFNIMAKMAKELEDNKEALNNEAGKVHELLNFNTKLVATLSNASEVYERLRGDVLNCNEPLKDFDEQMTKVCDVLKAAVEPGLESSIIVEEKVQKREIGGEQEETLDKEQDDEQEQLVGVPSGSSGSATKKRKLND